MSSSSLAASVLAIALSITAQVLATPKVALSYRATEDCPARSEFELALSARGAGLESQSGRAAVKALEVSISKREGAFWGSLRVESDAESSSLREVHAADCSEVVKGLAVVAAIALGADNQEAAAPVPLEAPPVAPALAVEPTEVPAPAPVENSERRRLRGSSFKRETEIEVQAGTLRVDRIYDLTLSAGAQFGLVPGLVLPRYEFTARVTHFMTPPEGSSRIVGPTLEVNWNVFGLGTRRSNGFATDVSGSGAGVRGCSAMTYDSEGLSLHLCSEFGVAWMRFKTMNAEGEVTQLKNTGIGVAGMGADLQYNFSRYFHVIARASGQLQIGSASAERPDGSSLFKVPLFGGHALLGLGVHF